MSITEARSFVGRRCAITWTDRNGREFKNVGLVHKAKFVPMYGMYLVLDGDEVCLDKVVGIEPLE